MNLPIIDLYALSNGMILIVVLLASAIRVKLERACHRQTVWFVVFRNNENKNIYTVVGGEWSHFFQFPSEFRIGIFRTISIRQSSYRYVKHNLQTSQHVSPMNAGMIRHLLRSTIRHKTCVHGNSIDLSKSIES